MVKRRPSFFTVGNPHQRGCTILSQYQRTDTHSLAEKHGQARSHYHHRSSAPVDQRHSSAGMNIVIATINITQKIQQLRRAPSTNLWPFTAKFSEQKAVQGMDLGRIHRLWSRGKKREELQGNERGKGSNRMPLSLEFNETKGESTEKNAVVVAWI